MSSAGTLETIANAVATALLPLETQLTPDNIIPFLAELGLQLPPQLTSQANFMNAAGQCATAVTAISTTLTKFSTDVANDDTAAIVADGLQLISDVGSIVSALEKIGTELAGISGSLPGVNAAELSTFAQNLVPNLLSYLFIDYLESKQSGALGIATLLGLVGYIPKPGVPGDPSHPPYIERKLQLSNIGGLISSPADLLKTLFGWGTPGFDGALFTPVIQSAASLLGAFPALGAPPGPVNSLALNLFSLRPDVATSPPGYEAALNYALPGTYNVTVPLSATWSAQLQAQGSFAAGLTTSIIPAAHLVLHPPTGTLSGTLQMTLTAQGADANHPLMIFGQTGGSRVQTDSFGFGAGIAVQWDAATASASADPQLTVQVKGGKVVIDMSDADGFLADVLSGVKVQGNFDLAATWQFDTGLHVTGGAQLEIDLPLHIDLGPASLQTLYLVGGIANDAITLEVSAALGVTLGPLQASVDRVGVLGTFDFPSSGHGNLGPLDLQLAFKPPNGLGLELDMGLAAGGGYITFDPKKGQYAGVLQVSLVDIVQVTVIGVLDTIMPDGSSGFSLILVITFDLPPIQLGFGFTLDGVGGVGGINRTMAIDALQAGFRAHTLDMVLAPPDPIANAPQIISDITSFFPVAEGRYLFGPMLTIGWGTPTLVSLDVGVLLEVPDPVRIVILGLIDAGLPTQDEALLQLHIAVLGVIDFGAETLSIDGSLYDSSLLIYSMAGDLALRLSWGSNPNMVFSLGGFNPHFNTDGLNVPANMHRMSVSIGVGNNPCISCNSYFAITSNSIQFGANVQAYAEAAGFSVQGYLGFDLLVIISPFSFEFDFSASFDVAFEGITLLGLSVDGLISGPTPWHFHGDASITLLFFTVSASIDLTWGSSTQATIPQQPVLPDLFKALQAPSSWSAALPSGTGPTVTLTKPASGSQTLLVHPMGTLTVKEIVVPLDLPITRYGNATPSDGTEFSIGGVSLNTQNETIQTITDYFAPGQFLTLSDADKLSKPSFERFDAGVTIGSSSVLSGHNSARTVTYDEYYVDAAESLSRFNGVYQMPAHIHLALCSQGAGFNSPAKHTGLGKYSAAANEPSIGVQDASYVVTSVMDLSMRTDIVSSSGSTFYQAQAALGSYLTAHPEEFSNLQIQPLHEVAA